MSTDTSERGLERRICAALTGSSCDAASTQQGPNGKAAVPSGSEGWACGHPDDYDRQYTVDLTQLLAFCVETQRDAYEGLQLGTDSLRRRKFLARLQSESLAGMHAPKAAQRFRHRWPQSAAEEPDTISQFKSPLPKFSSNLMKTSCLHAPMCWRTGH